MNVALWILQGLLALVFLSGGLIKIISSKDKFAQKYPWANDFSASSVRLIGVAEALGGIGLFVPELTGILPMLTPTAAAAIGILMLGAVSVHLRRGENKQALGPFVLFILSTFVAYGRFMQ